jgi:hypothetical protein
MPPSHSSKIRFNIILLSTPVSSKWSPSLKFPQQNPIRSSPLPHTCYMPCPSQSPWFDHPNDIWWGVQSIKLWWRHKISLFLRKKRRRIIVNSDVTRPCNTMCEVNADGNFDFYTKFCAVQLKYLFAQSVY